MKCLEVDQNRLDVSSVTMRQHDWLEVNQDGFEVSMVGPKNRERIRIVSSYPNGICSRVLFGWLGAMHLIAPYLPRVIRTNFTLSPLMRELIDAMYRWEFENCRIKSEKVELDNGRSAPSLSEIRSAKEVLPEYEHPDSPPIGFWSPLRTNRKRVVIAYSAGKDSMWNLWRATEQYGTDNVLIVHIRNLNKNNGSNEIAYVKKQQKHFGFKHLKVIELINSSLNTGYQTMRSRDMFLAGIIVPLAIEFGAGQIITDRKVFRAGARTFPLYLSQCGVCVKCKITNVARLLYDPLMQKIDPEDVKYFLRNTARWMREPDNSHDMITKSFMRDFRAACKRYGISLSS